MTKSGRETIRFMHMADLHLAKCPKEGRCGKNDRPCDICIKSKILSNLRERIASPITRPDLLLIAGDLTDVKQPSELVEATRPLNSLVRAAQAAGVVVAGIVGEHDGDLAARLRTALGWKWLMKTGEVKRFSGVAIHAVAGRAKQSNLRRDILRLRPTHGERSILLAHGDTEKVPRGDGPRFHYYAMGHRHWTRQIPFPGPEAEAVAAYPGHLFSYWDGCGKAWPVGVLEGEMDAAGRVRVAPARLSGLRGVPETRRMWIAAKDRGKSSGVLHLENVSDERSLRRICGNASVTPDPTDFPPNHYRHVADIRYGSLSDLRAKIRAVLAKHSADVFVSPAPGARW